MRIGVDVGGTYTDLAMATDHGWVIQKLPSTPGDPSIAVLASVEELDVPLADIDLFAHGTTVATNAVIQRTGTPTALLTTRGFRDILQIRRTTRGELYNFQWDPPVELVQRQWRKEVAERTNASGEITLEPDLEEVRQCVAELLGAGAQSLAICFLNAYLNGANERRVRDVIQKEHPDLPVYISSEILPEWREFERTSTTVVSAYTGPILSSYVQNLARGLHERGYRYDLMVMLSNGGLATAQAALKSPAYTLESGPAAGVLAQSALAQVAGIQDVIGMDIGGTSTDISLIHQGFPLIKSEYEIEFGTVVSYPVIDIESIGAGGGSIAWVDRGGLLHSGPQSAGAQPGPACLQKGGEEPTVTDANVVLHRLNPRYLLGGRVEISEEAARAAVGKVAERLGLDLMVAAKGILDLTVSSIVFAIRQRTLERGLDPREFALLAYGGAGPLHAADVAAELGVSKVLIPLFPGVTSAMGLLLTDIRHDFVNTFLQRADQVEPVDVASCYQELVERGKARLRTEGIAEARMKFIYSADLRYLGQTHELNVTLPTPRFDLETYRQLPELLHERHLREFGHAPELDEVIEIVNLRAACIGKLDHPTFPTIGSGTDAKLREARQVFFADQWVESPVFVREELSQQSQLQGPAIIEQIDSTTVVPPGWIAEVDEIGSLILRQN